MIENQARVLDLFTASLWLSPGLWAWAKARSSSNYHQAKFETSLKKPPKNIAAENPIQKSPRRHWRASSCSVARIEDVILFQVAFYRK